MDLIATDAHNSQSLAYMLEAYDCPAILVSPQYQILATNQNYRAQFGEIQIAEKPRCFEISHGYHVPCDEAGEDCPLATAQQSGRKERVLHVHQTPRGKEHVDVQLLPIHDDNKQLLFFVELLRTVDVASAEDVGQALVGTSKAFSDMLQKITRVSHSDASVLLLGESGSGKELVASAIHQGSKSKKNSLVTLECAGLTDSLFESELFGHVKGAFTGANSNRTGLVELANGGTLFLDEIGDVPLSMQVKLLRLIETGTFRPVGSSTIKHSNFRLVCATHKNIFQMIRNGEFRQDLYYRINVFPIHVPPLRERTEDLPLLISTLLRRISPKKEFFLTDPALKCLQTYKFPGNIRELRNILNRAIILSDTNLIEKAVIQECLAIDEHDQDQHSSIHQAPNDNDNWVDLKTAETQYLQKLMRANDQDKNKVAEIAGISLRSLYRKLEGIE